MTPWTKKDYEITGLKVLENEMSQLKIQWNPINATSTTDYNDIRYEVMVLPRKRNTCDCSHSKEITENKTSVQEPQWEGELEPMQWYYVQVCANDSLGRHGDWATTRDILVLPRNPINNVEFKLTFNDTSVTAKWKYLCPFVGDVATSITVSDLTNPSAGGDDFRCSHVEETECHGLFSCRNLQVDTDYKLVANFTFNDGFQIKPKEVWKDQFKTDARVPEMATCNILQPEGDSFTVKTTCMDQTAGTYQLAVILVGEVLPTPLSGEIDGSPKEHAFSLPNFRQYMGKKSKYFAIVTKNCSQELSRSTGSIVCSRLEQDSSTCENREDHCSGELSYGTYHYRLRYYTRKGYRDTEDETFSVAMSAALIVLICLVILIVMLVFLIAYITLKDKLALLTMRNRRKTHSMEMLIVPPPPSGRSACRPIVTGDIPEVVLALLADKSFQLRQEFQELKVISPKKTTGIAQLRENLGKNRYANISPYDETRVRLQVLPADIYSDYINASYIDGYDKARQFIACQGPKKNTINDFWRMIWEKDVHMIVMVTKCYEGKENMEKCWKYWPEANNVLGMELKKIGMTVNTLMETAHDPGGYVMRKLQLTKNSERRTVQQMHFVAWPDMDCPESPEQLIRFLKSVRDYTPHENRHTVVHCSAGVGRTGTFIALDILMSAIENEDHVDVFNAVYRMRASRMNMVQTEGQYTFLYKCLLQLYNDMQDDTDGLEVIEPSILDVHQPPDVVNSACSSFSNKHKEDLQQ